MTGELTFDPAGQASENHGLDCVYSHTGPLNTATASKEHLGSLEERLETLERQLRGLDSRVDRIEHRDGDPSPQSAHASSVPEHRIADAAIDEAEPHANVEAIDATDGVGSVIFTKEEHTGFYGPSSNIAFTRDIIGATMTVLKRSGAESVPDYQDSSGGFVHSHVLPVSRPPTPIAGQLRSSGVYGPSLNPFDLPPPDETLRLTYHELSARNFKNVRRSWLGMLNMIMALSTNTRYPSDLTQQQRRTESNVFYLRATVLCEKQIKFGASLEIVQYLLLVSHYLQGTESSVQTWNVHGLAVKASYQLGLHSKHALDRYSPLEREMRDSQSLYMIVGRVLDELYGSNLDCDTSQDIFKIASKVFQIEHQMSEAQRGIPSTLRLIEAAELLHEPRQSFQATKFRVVFSLRYNNLRILAHRPLLQRYLEILGNQSSDVHHLSSLHQIGGNSLRICVQAATSIVELMAFLTTSSPEDRGLLGAWWFSLYYTFNAALVIYSVLLIKAYTDAQDDGLALGNIEIRRGLLLQAVESLATLDIGNLRAEKCARYILKLERALEALSKFNDGRGSDATSTAVGTKPIGQAAGTSVAAMDAMADLFSQEQTPIGMDMSDLMVPGDLDFLKYFDPNMHLL
ncbi:unnamed protein product [Parascedosporium putredinis]|uniref:Xylanolytic transcriptional activator regulatory domain-containing protein n=1 Tax=Parascedosporium putredinis TaxID=1442378 RepID=A0A9P1H0W7_9PEZI|nr:unnamed protein product [Parascedosporium putredinis]CAI7993087.1 unnamed protein product [Parascedosporium putredinis]